MSLKILSRITALLALAYLAMRGSAFEISWERMPGKAKDISVGADGSVFVVGAGNGNEPVFRWNGTAWENRGGLAVLVAVGPNGDPWAVDKHSNLAHFQDGEWVPIVTDGTITDVSVGTNGTVYVVGGRFCNCGEVFNEPMYRLQEMDFVALNLSGVVIHPDPAGRLWTVDANAGIHRTATGTTTAITGKALDLAIGANGEVWIISRPVFDGNDGDVQFWDGTSFQKTTGFGARIAVAPDGTPWVTTDDDRIYRGRRLDLRIADAQAVEGQLLQFPVTLTAPAQKTVTLGYQLVAPPSEVGTNSSVVAGGQIALAPGQTNALITYQLPNDGVYQAVRVYSLQITNTVGANPPTVGIFGRVTDDEAVPPTLRVSTALAVLEGQILEFPLTLSPAAPQAIVINYRFFGPTNTPATNHGVLTTGALTLAPGDTNGVIRFLTLSNLLAEPDRNYRVEVQSAPGAVVQSAAASGPVLDDDVDAFTVTGAVTAVTAGSHFQVRVASRAGFEYSLERRDELTGSSGWQPVVSVTGSAGEIVLADPSEQKEAGYYRVTVRRRL